VEVDLSDTDSLKVTEQDDGTFLIEWDENDPQWSLFNGLSQEDMQTLITNAIEAYINDIEESENVSIYDD
jgi:hypothetical protein